MGPNIAAIKRVSKDIGFNGLYHVLGGKPGQVKNGSENFQFILNRIHAKLSPYVKHSDCFVSCLKMMDLTPEDLDRIVEMAWEDRTPFDAIEAQFGVNEKQVIRIMRKEMTEKSFKMWRKRVSNRATKHIAKRNEEVERFKCSRQKSISRNKISKR